jgi:hypothetical protein
LLFILAVNAGFIFSGEEKNCEKLGSCPYVLAVTRTVSRIIRVEAINLQRKEGTIPPGPIGEMFE